MFWPSALKIVIKSPKGKETYYLANFERTNASSSLNHRPLVKVGDSVHILETTVLPEYLAATCSTPVPTIGESQVKRDDVYTSLHIERYEIECRDTKLGPEEITRQLDVACLLPSKYDSHHRNQGTEYNLL